VSLHGFFDTAPTATPVFMLLFHAGTFLFSCGVFLMYLKYKQPSCCVHSLFVMGAVQVGTVVLHLYCLGMLYTAGCCCADGRVVMRAVDRLSYCK
jgi:hypothetical protein